MDNDIKNLREKLFSREFSKFCRKEFSKIIKCPMDQRKAKEELLKKIVLLMLVFGSICYLYIFFICGKISITLDFIVLAIVLFLVVIFVCKILYPHFVLNLIYQQKVKDIIIPKILSYVGDFKMIDPYDNIYRVRKIVSSSKLFEDIKEFACDDFIVGTYKGIKIRIAEVSLNYGSKISEGSPFSGLFVSFEMSKEFPTEIIILGNKEKYDKPKNRVYLEDSTFEKIYDVYSPDQIEARKIMTPSFMERLVRYSKIKKWDITLSVESNRINVAIKSVKNWFYIDTSYAASNANSYRRFLLDIIHVLSIVELLKIDNI